LNGSEIIGFPEWPVQSRRDDGGATPVARFDLVVQLQRVREGEIARIGDLAGQLAQRFGPAIAVGFLYYEILGVPPDEADCVRQAERLRHAPAAARIIIAELLAAADARRQSAAPVQRA
jgi:hypothetical protein